MQVSEYRTSSKSGVSTGGYDQGGATSGAVRPYVQSQRTDAEAKISHVASDSTKTTETTCRGTPSVRPNKLRGIASHGSKAHIQCKSIAARS